MAGDIKWYKYTTDDGASDFAMRGDVTNHDAFSNTAWASGDSPYLLPRNLEPRTVVLAYQASGAAGQGTGLVVRRVAISTKAAYDAIAIGDTKSLPEYQAVAGVGQLTPNVMRDFQVVEKLNERLRPTPRALNTGETQG